MADSKNFKILKSIKNKVNIVNIISNFLSLDKKGNNYWALCPFHKDDNPSLSVSEKKQLFNCFACNTKGDVFTFVQLYKHISYSKAILEVCELAGIDKKTIALLTKNNSYNAKFEYYYSINQYANNFFKLNLQNNDARKANEYLKKRHLDKTLIDFFGIGYALDKKDSLARVLPALDIEEKITLEALKEIGLVKNNNENQDFFINRIMFPIHNHNGNIVGFSGRSLSDKSDVKYLNTEVTEIFKKEEIFYNFFRVKNLVKNDSIYLCEGYMDVIALHRIGIQNAVALMGLNLSDFQLNVLKEQKWLKKIYLCLDNDEAGISYSNKLAEKLLNNNLEIWFVKPYDTKYKDLDELVNQVELEEVKNIIDNKVDYFEYLRINALKKVNNRPQANDLITISNEILQKIKDYADPIVQDIYIQNLAENLKLDQTELKNKFVKLNKTVIKKNFKNKRNVIVDNNRSLNEEITSPVSFSTKIPITSFSKNNVKNYERLILIDELNLVSKFYKFKNAVEDFKNLSNIQIKNPVLNKIYVKLRIYYNDHEKISYADFKKIINDIDIKEENKFKVINDLTNIINGQKMDRNVYDRNELISIMYRWSRNVLTRDFIVNVNNLNLNNDLKESSNQEYVKEYSKEAKSKQKIWNDIKDMIQHLLNNSK